ncbi:MAG: hypothetical protein AB3N09_03770 [Tateyamaria sp.]
MTLAWRTDIASKTWVNGEELEASWIKAGEARDEVRLTDTTWTIVNTTDIIWASDGGHTVGIARKDQSSTVSATLMPVRARRCVDYGETVGQRRVFTGACEGLF